MTHPLDRVRFQPELSLVHGLFERYSIEALIQHYEEVREEEPERELVISTQLRLTPLLAPRLYALFEEVCSRLGFREKVDLFVQSEANVNGMSLRSMKGDRPHIVSLTSGMIERMTDDELRFVLGHEVGHLHFNHHRPRLVYSVLGVDEEGESKVPALLERRMESWERLAELSADRAGFLAVEGRLEPVVSAFFKLTSGLGPEHLRFDIEAFLSQLSDLQQMKRREVLARFSHPVTPVRVRALQLFGELCGGHLPELDAVAPDEARMAAFQSALEQVDGQVSTLAQLMEYEVTEPLEVNARDFLLAAGLLAADADGAGMSADEHELLIHLLLPMAADPEAQMQRVSTRVEAKELLQRSAAWLRGNAGEERYLLFRQLAHLVGVDGVLAPKEKSFMLSLAKQLAIPARAATEILYEVLGEYLQSRPWDHRRVFGVEPRTRRSREPARLPDAGIPEGQHGARVEIRKG